VPRKEKKINGALQPLTGVDTTPRATIIVCSDSLERYVGNSQGSTPAPTLRDLCLISLLYLYLYFD
jgi:hypothetical protein